MYGLEFQFHSDWAITSGESAGAYADITTMKSADGLPFIPGKSIKGLLRDAFDQAGELCWPEHDNLLTCLFGEEGADQQGALQCSSAELSSDEKAYFQHNKEQTKFLFRTVHSTKINEQTGSAQEGSLRAMEVVVPMNLMAECGFNQTVLEAHGVTQSKAITALEHVLPLITELGAKRTRGYGQVSVKLVKQGGE